MNVVIAERAERLSRLRAYAAIVLGIALGATQARRMDAAGAGPVPWIVTAVTVAIFLVWGSGVLRNSSLRGILNDEGSDANRRRALMLGFWNMLATGIVCYALSYIKDYGPRDAIQIIMTVGMSSALFGFGIMERVSARE